MSSFSPVGQTIWPDIGQVTVTCGTQTVRLAKVILVVTEKKKINVLGIKVLHYKMHSNANMN